MENHTELAELLLAGLPPEEREQVAEMIDEATEDKLRRLRAQQGRKRGREHPQKAAER